MCLSYLISDETCEKIIEVDGEPASVTLLDTWDAEVRGKTHFILIYEDQRSTSL